MLTTSITAKLFFSAGVLTAAFVIPHIISYYIKQLEQAKHIDDARINFLIKLIRSVFLISAILVVTLLWGMNIKNIWMLITSVFGIVAIGFFAVWSILSNVVCGFLLLFSEPFKIGDWVEIMPDAIKGKVVDMKLFFVVIKSQEQNSIHVPNNVLFQKYIVKLANENHSPKAEKEGNSE